MYVLCIFHSKAKPKFCTRLNFTPTPKGIEGVTISSDVLIALPFVFSTSGEELNTATPINTYGVYFDVI